MTKTSVSQIVERCRRAGIPDQATTQIVNAVAAFNSGDVRMRAVDALIDAWHRDNGGGDGGERLSA